MIEERPQKYMEQFLFKREANGKVFNIMFHTVHKVCIDGCASVVSRIIDMPLTQVCCRTSHTLKEGFIW